MLKTGLPWDPAQADSEVAVKLERGPREVISIKNDERDHAARAETDALPLPALQAVQALLGPRTAPPHLARGPGEAVRALHRTWLPALQENPCQSK